MSYTVVGTPATPQFLQLVVRGYMLNNDGVTSKNILNVFNFYRSSAWTPETENHAAGGIMAILAPQYLACLSVKLVGVDTVARFLDSPLSPAVVTANPAPGGVAGDCAASIQAAYCKQTTNTRGKNFRGSKHFGPIAESDTTLQEIAAASLAKFATFAAALTGSIAVAGGNTWGSIILSQTLSDLISNPATITYDVISASNFAKTLGTMRRRKESAKY